MNEPILQIERVAEGLKVLRERAQVRKLGGYDPYPFQRAFHRCRSGKWQEGQFSPMGGLSKQTLLSAGNQVGKTECGAADVAIHATGEYPAWWDGPDLTDMLRSFPLIWCGGKNNDRVRDIAQAMLCGNPADPAAWGTGYLPKENLVDRVLKSGVRNAFESVTVRHRQGFLVTIAFKSYDAQLLDWAGQPVTLLWLDEEPSQPIYSQAMARTIASAGFVRMTFTPEEGATQVVSEFTTNLKDGQLLMYVGWDDAKHEDGRTHLNEEAKTQLLAAFLPHERDMRTRGLPVLGAGNVFPIAVELILCDPIQISRHMRQIAGMDFGRGGMNHPTACAWLAYDPDSDVTYVTREYKSPATEAPVHAAAIKHPDPWIPIAWPHDGHRAESYASEGVAKMYREQPLGLRMLVSHAINDDGSINITPGLVRMYNDMVTGKFKVFRHLLQWQAEFRMYHYKQDVNEIEDRNDDLMSATRYAYISRKRHGAQPPDFHSGVFQPQVAGGVTDYNPLEGM